MAFIAFENGPAFLPLAHSAPSATAPVATTERFSPLEWLVIALARKDRLSSLKRPGRLAAALRVMFSWYDPSLADARLEALRRIAVLNWHHGAAIDPAEVDTFLAAGFSAGQYRLMLDSMQRERTHEPVLA